MTARILFVDDSLDAAFLAQCLLTRAGIRSEGRLVQDQLSLQRTLLSWVPHLIVSEFSLSSLDGWTAYIVARSLRPSVPFVFRSRKVSGKHSRRARDRGVTACIKNDEIERFVSFVKAAITHADDDQAEGHRYSHA